VLAYALLPDSWENNKLVILSLHIIERGMFLIGQTEKRALLMKFTFMQAMVAAVQQHIFSVIESEYPWVDMFWALTRIFQNP